MFVQIIVEEHIQLKQVSGTITGTNVAERNNTRVRIVVNLS